MELHDTQEILEYLEGLVNSIKNSECSAFTLTEEVSTDGVSCTVTVVQELV